MMIPRHSMNRLSIPFRISNQSGFTVVELLSAGLLTIFFFGWLTYAYLTVTRITLRWQEEWALASVTHRALGQITRDLEDTVILEALSPSRVTGIRTDGQRITSVQRDDGVYRNDRKFGNAEVFLKTLHMAGLWDEMDSATDLPERTDTPRRPPDRLRVTVVGQTGDRTCTAQTIVRLYGLRPTLVHEE